MDTSNPSHVNRTPSTTHFLADYERGRLEFIKETILPTLWTRKEAIPFMKHTDNFNFVSDGIQQPMDLSTIRERLNTCFYKTTWECFSDFRLIFKNTLKHYPLESPIYQQAKSLEAALLELLRTIPKREMLQNRNCKSMPTFEAETGQPGQTVPPSISKTQQVHCLRKVIVDESDSSLSSGDDAVFKVPATPPPKRRRMARPPPPTYTESQGGNGSLSEGTSSITNRGSSTNGKMDGFETQFHAKQLAYISTQMRVLQNQLFIMEREDWQPAMERLLNRQRQLNYVQREWLNVRTMEEFHRKEQQELRIREKRNNHTI